MSPEEYRKIALGLPGAEERSHLGHPDFRVNGKIFATLWKEEGVLLLTRDQQESLTESKPKVFSPVKGGWGQKGSTRVVLENADRELVRFAMSLAWSNKAASVRKAVRK